MIQTKDRNLALIPLCREIKKRDINLRICLNMNDGILAHHPPEPAQIVRLCDELEADQITFRALWASDGETEQGRWIAEHVTAVTTDLIAAMKADIKKNGTYLDTLEYGADRYDHHGFSVVVDEDSMAKGPQKDAVKYLILRPNGHLYSKWDSKASLIF